MARPLAQHIAALAIVAGSVVLPGPPALGDRTQGARDPSRERVERLLHEGRFQEARSLASEQLERAGPEDASSWRSLIARSFAREGDLEGAERAWADAAGSERGRLRLEALLELARVRLQMFDPEAAAGTLGEAGPWPGDLDGAREEILALAALQAGRKAEARRKLESLKEKGAEAWYQLGVLAFDRGRYEEALKYFDSAERLVPDDYYTTLYAAWSLLEAGQTEGARLRLEKLLSLADTAEAHQLLGRLELRCMNYAEAERRFRRSLDLDPALSESLFGLATALRLRGEAAASREVFARFRKAHREQQDAMRELYRLNQRYEATSGDDPALAEKLARLYLGRADLASAEQLAWRALRRDPERAGARLCLARVLSRLGRYREAFVQYRRVVATGGPLRAEGETELRRLVEEHSRERR